MSVSKEDIEKKRLAALEKIRLKNINLGTVKKTEETSNILGIKQRYEPYNSAQRSSASQFYNRKIVSGRLYLITEDKFEVEVSEFCEQLIDVFKSIPSKNYDGEKKLWNFSLIHYEELLKKVSPLKPHIVLGTIPQNVLNIVRSPANFSEIDISKIDPHLGNKLMPFQVEGVMFGIRKKGRCMIADDMGLGKTFQALAIANYYINEWPLLIVTTSSMRATWESKMTELIPSVPMMNIVSLSSSKEKEYLTDSGVQVVITSYSMCVRSLDVLQKKKFGVIILDESHLLKSHKAQSTLCVMKLTKACRHVILLSGTPALSRPCELYTQLQIIDPHFFTSYTEYGKRYCAGKQTNFGWDMTGQSNLQELQVLLSKKFLIRRTKEQILLDLKEKTRESVLLDSELILSKSGMESLSQASVNFQNKKSKDKHGALLVYFCETAKAKIPAICKYVNEVINNSDKKFLIFAHHRIVLEAISNVLDDYNIHYITIDGTTKTDSRNNLVEKFQYNDTCRCAVLSLTAANAGITLTAAQLVIFAELHWNPGILIQAEARAHRIGQKDGVSIKYLIARNTVDDFMWPMLEKKLQVLNKVGLSKDTFQNTVHSIQKDTSQNNLKNYFNEVNSSFASSSMSEIENDDLDMNHLDISSFLQDEEGDDLLANINF